MATPISPFLAATSEYVLDGPKNFEIFLAVIFTARRFPSAIRFATLRHIDPIVRSRFLTPASLV
ncbi:hypothetical protein ES703_101479 [subsurface metagenome]